MPITATETANIVGEAIDSARLWELDGEEVVLSVKLAKVEANSPRFAFVKLETLETFVVAEGTNCYLSELALIKETRYCSG